MTEFNMPPGVSTRDIPGTEEERDVTTGTGLVKWIGATDAKEMALQISNLLEIASVDEDASKVVRDCIEHLHEQHALIDARLEVASMKEFIGTLDERLEDLERMVKRLEGTSIRDVL